MRNGWSVGIIFLLVVAMLPANVAVAYSHGILCDTDGFGETSRIGEIFKNESGEYEKIIRIEEEGGFLTEVVHPFAQTIQSASCTHPTSSLKKIKDMETSYKILKKPTVCYKSRKRVLLECEVCRCRLYAYENWINHKHDFPLFGRICNFCHFTK